MRSFRSFPLLRFRRLRPLRTRTLLILLALLLVTILYLHFNWLPTVQTLVTMTLDNETSNLINEAVDAYLAGGGLCYEDLVCLERTADGGVSAARIDLTVVNRMKSNILQELDQRIPDRVRQSVRIPLGSVIMPSLFSGHGISLPVRIIELRSTNAELESSFSQAGVNQTLHTLSLRVEVDMILLTPAGILSHQIHTNVPVVQTIIVGNVPSIVFS